MAPPMSAPRRRLRGPAWVLGIGLALIGLAAGAWLVGWWRYGDVPETTSREASAIRSRFEAELAVPGQRTVDLDEGRHLVYVVVPAGPAAGDEIADPDRVADGLTVALVGPDGDVLGPVAPDPNGASTAAFQGTGTDFELGLAAELMVPADGDYTLTIDGDPPAGVTTAGIVEVVDPHAGADAILAGGALFLLGLLVGGVGGLVVLIGGIWLLVALATR